MTGTEAARIVAVLQAAYPSTPWPEPTVAVWVQEFLPLTAGEGMAAAQGMYRSHNFPTVANFHAELAAVRERRADHHEPTRPALMSGELITAPEEAKALVAQLRARLRDLDGPHARPLATVAGHHRHASQPARPPKRRVDETFFYPPEPQAAPPEEPDTTTDKVGATAPCGAEGPPAGAPSLHPEEGQR